MSMYVGDPRVTLRANGSALVRSPDPNYPLVRVLYLHTFGWVISWGEDMDFVPMADGPGGFATGFPDLDTAIHALLGEPINTKEE